MRKKKCGCDGSSITMPKKIGGDTPSIITTVTMCQKHFIKKYGYKELLNPYDRRSITTRS